MYTHTKTFRWRPTLGPTVYIALLIVLVNSAFTTAFCQCINDPPGDLNGDCLVNFADFAFIADNWLNDYSTDPNYAVPTDVIFVSAIDGNDVAGCGPNCLNPCASIQYGILRAQNDSRQAVYVADGIYAEQITLADGIHLRGGFDPCTWSRQLYTTNTIIIGTNTGLHKKAIIANNLTQNTIVEGFVIYGQNNFSASGNSYAFYVLNSPDLAILNNWIIAGDGGKGANGTKGADGANGTNGSNGIDASDTGSHPCNDSKAGGTGGSQTCQGDDVSGGNGGSAICPPDANTQTSAHDGLAGQPGMGAGGGSGGSGGSGGYDYELHNDGTCYTFGNPANGGDGTDGGNGSDGGSGMGASDSDGSISAGEWIGQSGYSGGNGGPGGGGGGGGAGGGAEGAGANDQLGGSGGGGGSGGCGGNGGTGGDAGGGSFAIFIIDGNAPTIQNNDIIFGNGGNGGSGGSGGVAGFGGSGSTGGAGGGDLYCTGKGGDGGSGGDGGHGGGGGGGAGGVSIGIYTYNVTGSFNYCDLANNNSFYGGQAGSGGGGGLSYCSPGSSGTDGTLADCSVH